MKNEEKLLSGAILIYEPGLEPIVQRDVYYKRLYFTTDIQKAVEDNDVIFIAVGTPPSPDGSANLQFVEAVARDIAKHMAYGREDSFCDGKSGREEAGDLGTGL